MMTLTTIAHWTVRLTGAIQIVLGLMFWTGRALRLLPLHMLNGMIFVLALLALVGLGVWTGLRWPVVVLALAWALSVPAFGMLQTRLLPGPAHWVVQATHLLIGIVAMAEGAALARFIRIHPRRARPLGAVHSMPG